jgi:hypothetical protein
MPLLPPVITATLPSNRPIVVTGGWSCALRRELTALNASTDSCSGAAAMHGIVNVVA